MKYLLTILENESNEGEVALHCLNDNGVYLPFLRREKYQSLDHLNILVGNFLKNVTSIENYVGIFLSENLIRLDFNEKIYKKEIEKFLKLNPQYVNEHYTVQTGQHGSVITNVFIDKRRFLKLAKSKVGKTWASKDFKVKNIVSYNLLLASEAEKEIIKINPLLSRNDINHLILCHAIVKTEFGDKAFEELVRNSSLNNHSSSSLMH
jgi:hypothetical protein